MVLSFSRNADQGAVYRDLTDRITSELTETIDRVSQGIPSFFFGRYDIKFGSLNDFLMGKCFKILEINGCYSTDGRQYSDPEYMRIFSRIVTQVKLDNEMLKIAAENKAQGFKMKTPLGMLKERSDTRRFIRNAKSSNG